MLFAFFAIIIGVVSNSLSGAIIGSSGMTAMVMAFVFTDFAIVMGAVFVISVVVKIMEAYTQQGSCFGY